MAKRWRIRHKLLLGLGLVLGTFGLLLTGTLQGLSSYLETMRYFDAKVSELGEAEAFQNAVKEIRSRGESVPNIEDEEAQLRGRLALAKEKIAAYERRLNDTIERRQEPDLGKHEKALIQDVHSAFAQFDKAIEKAKGPVVITENDTKRIIDYPAVVEVHKTLVQLAAEIPTAIKDEQFRRIAASKTEGNRNIAVLVATAVVGMLIMAGLSYFFYGWIFRPLAELQDGVRRVAAGNFDSRIELQSGDELEELAEAFNDMTKRLHLKYSDLTNQVTERGKQLVRSERLASVGFLAAGVAHEINNPLASIAFCGEALERRLADLLVRLPSEQEAVTKYLKMIQQEAFRCKAITQNLLEFSRVGEGERTPTNLVEMIQSVIEMAQHLKASEGKHIEFRPSSRLVARVNPQEIKQVVLNMVVNAMESMDDGGTLTISLVQRGGAAELIFEDTGCGMSADVMENIFQPFFTRSRTGKGTGLGLSISSRIVTQHGGEIEATSPGTDQGSTFVVRLPLVPALSVKEEHLVRAAA